MYRANGRRKPDHGDGLPSVRFPLAPDAILMRSLRSEVSPSSALHTHSKRSLPAGDGVAFPLVLLLLAANYSPFLSAASAGTFEQLAMTNLLRYRVKDPLWDMPPAGSNLRILP